MDEDEVRAAAATLVAAFGEHRVEDYFDCFASDATFVFHTTAEVLASREEYRRLWRRWEDADGFRVLGCESLDGHVQMLGDVAVFTHRVRTRVRTREGTQELHERETIAFQRTAGGWAAVHEHLSPVPDAATS